MISIYKYDRDGFFTVQELFSKDDRIPANATITPPMIDNGDGTYTGYFRAKFVNGNWVEGATIEETEKTEKEIIPKKTEEMLRVEILEQEIALVWYEIAIGGI